MIIITVARKPPEGTVVANVKKWGTGGLNLGGCRVGDKIVTINRWIDGAKPFGGGAGHPYQGRTSKGRWPANLILQGDGKESIPLSATQFFQQVKE